MYVMQNSCSYTSGGVAFVWPGEAGRFGGCVSVRLWSVPDCYSPKAAVSKAVSCAVLN